MKLSANGSGHILSLRDGQWFGGFLVGRSQGEVAEGAGATWNLYVRYIFIIFNPNPEVVTFIIKENFSFFSGFLPIREYSCQC